MGRVDPSDAIHWAPTGADVLRGMFHLYEDVHWAVRDDEGTVWLLEDDAESKLRDLGPDEGQPVQVMFMQESSRESRYLVSIHSVQPIERPRRTDRNRDTS